MKRMLLVLMILSASFCVKGQQNMAAVDTFKAQLSRVTNSEERVMLLGSLSMTMMNTNIPEADQYGAQMAREAELSRNRALIIKAYQINGQRYSFFGSNRDFIQKSLDYYTKGLEMADKNKMDKEKAECLLSISTLYTTLSDLDKAMNYATQASSIASNLDNDSLKVAVYYSFGAVYQLRKERILALRNYLNALRLAEEKKDPLLLRSCYYVLSQFYAELKEYDKAIDYLKEASKQLTLTKTANKEYTAVVDLYMMGDLYMQEKNFDMAMFFYDSSIKKAEVVKYYPLKMPGYRGILRQYIQARQPEKALAYLNQATDLKQFIVNFGAPHIVDNSYAAIYMQLGRYDSAGYYFARAAKGFEVNTTPAGQIPFYFQYADFFNKSGNGPKALDYYSKAMALADQTKDLEWQQRIAKELDTIYATSGQYKESRFYNNLYYTYKDSLQKLGEEKDLMQMELADEEQRQQRREREEAEALRESHNIQYMGITIAIAAVFLLLVLMGAFKVSEATIKIMGFFAFILLFEFIILIADNQIHSWTHGEPLPVLGIKIILIAMLLPLHHWLEHKVVNYLASKRLIIPDRKSIWSHIVSKGKGARQE